jgi:hypothetical protein
MSVIEDARRFLNLHASGVKGLDDPIDLLKAIVDTYSPPVRKKERPSKR